MSAFDLTAADSILKEYYTKDQVESMVYKNAPLMAMLKKMTEFTGKSLPIPINITTPQGRSATFSNAVAQKTGSVYKDFNITRAKDYALASIDTETLLASESDAGAFLRAATSEIDGAINSLKRSLAWSLYGDGSGAIAQVASSSDANNTITLLSADDVVKFEVGQTLVVYSAKSSGSQRNYDGSNTSLTVLSVDRDSGIIGVNENITSSKTIAANDYIFVAGDRGLKLKGLDAWLPSAAPSVSENFFGVDRSVDATRLAGIRVSGVNKPMDEACIDIARRIGREGGLPDTMVTSFTNYASLEKTLGARVKYVDVKVGNIGFSAIEITGPKGKIVVVPDQDCPNAASYMLQLDTWKLYSLGEPVILQDLDGNRMLRESSSDAYEVRASSYSQLGCAAPGWNGRLAHS